MFLASWFLQIYGFLGFLVSSTLLVSWFLGRHGAWTTVAAGVHILLNQFAHSHILASLQFLLLPFFWLFMRGPLLSAIINPEVSATSLGPPRMGFGKRGDKRLCPLDVAMSTSGYTKLVGSSGVGVLVREKAKVDMGKKNLRRPLVGLSLECHSGLVAFLLWEAWPLPPPSGLLAS